MERAGLAPRQTSSRHSFQDGSEIISEVEETNEVKGFEIKLSKCFTIIFLTCYDV
jgi:hypothetical protein